MNELQLRLKKGKNRNFRVEYADYMQSQGSGVTRWPVFGGKKLDLQAVYEGVTSRGGFDKVSSAKQWKDIAKIIDTPATCTSASFALKNLYQKWLLSFEEHKRRLERAAEDSANKVAASAKAGAASSRNKEGPSPQEKGRAKKEAPQSSPDPEEEEADDDLLDAFLELETRAPAEPPAPKRQKLEMVRSRGKKHEELIFPRLKYHRDFVGTSLQKKRIRADARGV